MCLIFISIKQHPTYKLILAANRDEFYGRKTANAHFWEDHPHIVGGRDLEANGTWLAMTKSGKLSMLTNYRDVANLKTVAPSRGQLVSDYLIHPIAPDQYLKDLEPTGHQYNGFNLLIGSIDELWYYSNYQQGITPLNPGFYGLSNHLLNSPWPKVTRGKEKLAPILRQSIIHPDQLFESMQDEQRAADTELPQTGLPLDREQALSSMFIKTENYGSRCSTVILVDNENNVHFAERVYNPETFQFTTQSFQFTTRDH